MSLSAQEWPTLDDREGLWWLEGRRPDGALHPNRPTVDHKQRQRWDRPPSLPRPGYKGLTFDRIEAAVSEIVLRGILPRKG